MRTQITTSTTHKMVGVHAAAHRYRIRKATFNENLGALYALLVDGVSKIVFLKVKSKNRYVKIEEANDSL